MQSTGPFIVVSVAQGSGRRPPEIGVRDDDTIDVYADEDSMIVSLRVAGPFPDAASAALFARDAGGEVAGMQVCRLYDPARGSAAFAIGDR